MKKVYGLLCLLGIVLPYSQLVPWVLENGLNMSNLWQPVLGTCLVGVSLGFPLFLLLREIHLDNQRSA